MRVTLLDYTVDPVNTIGKMAAECYDAKTDRVSNVKRAAHCKEKGHLSTLRFAYATFGISGISRICSHQLVRVAHSGILQQSQRFVAKSRIEYVIPEAVNDLPEELKCDWEGHLRASSNLYKRAMEAGMKKEDARYILPQSCTTQMNITMNFQAWRDLLGNRTKPAAQWEVRNLAIGIQNQLHEIAPEIFDEIVEPA
jgi:thymidylate synthase (FAD)